MAETEGSDDTSENELLDKSLSVWKGGVPKERFEPIPLDLHTASSLGQYEAVKMYIIRKDIDIDKRNRGGWTPLMYACYIGHDNIVNLLLEAGVNVNIRNHKGETPLMLASSCGNESVGYFLLHRVAEIEARDERGWTALFHATYSGHQNMQVAEIEARDERGWTALFHATYSGHQNMVRFLLEHGANMNAVERSMGMTPFMEAAAEGHEIIVQLFLQNGVDVNTRAYNGDTARSLALMHGNMKIVSLIDNHVMPITSLRAEPGLESDLASSDNAIFRTRRGAPGGGPSIMDGPAAIARLIDRTKDAPAQPKQPVQGLVPKGYVTFPDGETPSSNGLSNREVTSPINPEDCSRSRDSFEVEDDTNAFSKTGALTIKSSSGSSGGLAGIFGIGGREESLDSDDFPHESSCDDFHRPGYSGESSSDEGVEESADPTEQIAETLKINCKVTDETNDTNANETNEEKSKEKCEVKEKRKLRNKKSKENLTTEKVNEIESMKTSVSEWVDSVNQSQPTPQADLYPAESELNGNPADSREVEVDINDINQSALKPEYQNKPHVVNGAPKHYTFPAPSQQEISSQPVVKTPLTTSELFDQVAENVKNKTQNDYTSDEERQMMSDNIGKGCIPPVSALNLLNTNPNSVPSFTSFTEGQGQKDVIKSGQEPNTNRDTSYNKVNHSPFAIPQGQNHISQGQSNTPYSQGHSSQGQGHSSQGQGSTPYSQGHSSQGQGHIPQGQLAQDQTHITNISPASHPTNDGTFASPTRFAPPPTGRPIQPPPGFSPQFSPYQMFPAATTTTLPVIPTTPGTSTNNSTAQTDTDGQTSDSVKPSSNMAFMDKMKESQPTDLQTLLEQLGLLKHLPTFQEQDVDLQVFLTLSDNDLKEIGIKLFGPRKKMTNAIARWHSKARIAVGELEQAYADRLAGELQDMNAQLQVACEHIDTLKAQIAQEQQLRNVTETCLMEERAAWSQVQRIIMDTRQQCEDFKDAMKKLNVYSNELKARVPADTSQPQPKRPIRGAGAMRDDQSQDRGIVTYDKLPTETLIRKMDAYLQENYQLLGNITTNTDRLLGRNTQSMDSGFS